MRKIAITTLKSGFWILTTNFTKRDNDKDKMGEYKMEKANVQSLLKKIRNYKSAHS